MQNRRSLIVSTLAATALLAAGATLSAAPALAKGERVAVLGANGRTGKPVVEQLLPLAPARLEQTEAEKKQYGWDYIYEPDAPTVIDDLMTRYIEALVYQGVAENMASEQSARMVAMKAATDNAGTLIGELKLIYNKTRQAAITKELSEIVSGAAAISG